MGECRADREPALTVGSDLVSNENLVLRIKQNTSIGNTLESNSIEMIYCYSSIFRDLLIKSIIIMSNNDFCHREQASEA